MTNRILDEYLLINEDGHIVCRKCNHVFCCDFESYKENAIVKEVNFKDIDLSSVSQSFYIDRKVIFRQFFCPGCATNLENDVVYSDTRSLDDKKLL